MENNKKFLFVIVLFFIILIIINNNNNKFTQETNNSDKNNLIHDTFSNIGSTSYASPVDDNISNTPFNKLLLGITTDNKIKIGAYDSTNYENYSSSYWYSFYGEGNTGNTGNNISNVNSLSHDSYMNFIGCDEIGNFIIGASPTNFNKIDTNCIGGSSGTTRIIIKDVCRINDEMYCITDTGSLHKALTLIDNINVESKYKEVILYLLIYSAYMDSLNSTDNSIKTNIINPFKFCLVKNGYSFTYNSTTNKFTEIKKGTLKIYSNEGSTAPKYYSNVGDIINIIVPGDNNSDTNTDKRYITIQTENGTNIGYINNSMSLLSTDKTSIINQSYFFNDYTFTNDDKISTNIFWSEDLLKDLSINVKNSTVKLKSISDNKDDRNFLCTGDNGTVFYFCINDDKTISLTDLININTHPMKKVIKLSNGIYLGISDKTISGLGTIIADENCLYYGIISNYKIVWNIVNTNSNYPKFKYISNIEFGMKLVN